MPRFGRILPLLIVCFTLGFAAYVYLRARKPPQPEIESANRSGSRSPSANERELPQGDPISRPSSSSSDPASRGNASGIGPGDNSGREHQTDAESGVLESDYNRVYSGRDVSQKARVIFKPEPGYTEAARQNQIVGTVVLRAVFSSSGNVTQITAVKSLPYGLTEKAIAAAKAIKFVPAIKDGHNVSMYMQLEYSFNLY